MKRLLVIITLFVYLIVLKLSDLLAPWVCLRISRIVQMVLYPAPPWGVWVPTA